MSGRGRFSTRGTDGATSADTQSIGRSRGTVGVGMTNPSHRQRDLTDEERREIKEAFDLFDTDKDGAIDYHELKVALRALGFDVKRAEVQQLMREFDRDGTGLISERDFTTAVTPRVLGRNPIEEIMKAFQLFDDDKTGKIDLRNLRRVARELGEDIPEEEMQAMIREFDQDGDGQINEDEFISIMTADF
eukprot:m.362817 g.362817  ORF g.362817 m.362817 type:complete len:190 (+) comp20930_c0_seq1:48-617(+)